MGAALVGSGATGGGAFTPAEAASYFFDLLPAASVALQFGIRQIRTERDSVQVPHVSADPSSSWVAEGAQITASDPTADIITATPRKVAALTVTSNEVLADSEPPILNVLALELVRSLGLRYDLGVFQGSGTPPEIRGLANIAGVQGVDMGAAAGAQLTNLDPFADAIGLLNTENANPTAIVMHPRTWRSLIKVKEGTANNNKPLLQESSGSGAAAVQRSIYGVPVWLSSQLSITESHGSSNVSSSAYVYQADQVVAVIRADATVAVDTSQLFDHDQAQVRCVMRADMVLPNPKAVCRISGIIP